MNLSISSFLALALAGVSLAADTGKSPEAALRELRAGNIRFVTGKPARPHQTVNWRVELAKGQQPFAAVLSCSDSRVPPELVFDQGMGDLFVVRVAGNMVTDEVLGSLEYAVEHLHSKLIVVMGHQRCGAVDATLKGGTLDNHIMALLMAIQPAVDSIQGSHAPGDPLAHAVRANVIRNLQTLRESEPILKEALAGKHIRIVGAIYDLDTGKVEILP